MALVRTIRLDIEFKKWIKMKQPTTRKDFDRKASWYLRLEKVEVLEGKPANIQPTNAKRREGWEQEFQQAKQS